ncbi:MAG TPA: FAD:protein FMN transferase [Opitutaceae bacterium]|nr:FAD:protein FMN transferase [Opitutaceae bacterium]
MPDINVVRVGQNARPTTSTGAGIQIEGVDALERFEHEAMVTKFTAHLAPGGDNRSLAAECFREIDRIEALLSFYRESSDVTRVNRAEPGATLRIAPETAECLAVALEAAALTHGAFDPFAGRAAVAAKHQHVPLHLDGVAADDADTRPCLAFDPATSMVTRLDGRRWLDLGAIGKGHALDCALAVLRDWGATRGLLVAGGSSVLGFDFSDAPAPWRCTVRSACGERTLELPANFALGASGEGFQPGHIVDTRSTGGARRRRSFVLAPTAALADALATGVFLASANELDSLAAARPDVSALADGEAASGAPEEIAHGIFAAAPAIGPAVALVLPCWRESKRLPRFLPGLCESIATSGLRVEVIVSDDGSPPTERAATSKFVETLRPRFKFLRALAGDTVHRGKGAAIRAGWSAATQGAAVLAFVDADGAVPADDVVSFLREALAQPNRMLAATRVAGSEVTRTLHRRIASRAFAAWARLWTGTPVSDPQCGLKAIPAAMFARHEWREEGFAFDLELLTAARRDAIAVAEFPVRWREVGHSRLRWGDIFALFAAAPRVRRAAGKAR